MTSARSERKDKRCWHQRWRTRERDALVNASARGFEEHLSSLENDVSSVWTMDKDGRHYWLRETLFDVADIHASKGRTVRERAVLKVRWLRTLLGK